MNQNQFNEMMAHLQGNLRGFICSQLRPRDIDYLRDDILGDVMLEAWASRNRYDPAKGAKVGTWVNAIAKNVIKRHYEKWARYKTREERLETAGNSYVDLPVMDDDGERIVQSGQGSKSVDRDQEMDRNAERRDKSILDDEMNRVRGLILMMPRPYAQVMALATNCLFDRSIDEIGGALEILPDRLRALGTDRLSRETIAEALAITPDQVRHRLDRASRWVSSMLAQDALAFVMSDVTPDGLKWGPSRWMLGDPARPWFKVPPDLETDLGMTALYFCARNAGDVTDLTAITEPGQISDGSDLRRALEAAADWLGSFTPWIRQHVEAIVINGPTGTYSPPAGRPLVVGDPWESYADV